MGRETEQQQPMAANTVDQLVDVNPYNPDILPDLENYVNEQVSSNTYSLDANLCLLRFYQFEPERMSVQIVARILIKALMAMPALDFSLCLFLIPERVSPFPAKNYYLFNGRSKQMEEPFKTLIVLSHYLETGRFHQFWEEVAKSRQLVEAVPGFEQAVQSYAIHVLSLTYEKVPRAVLAEAVNIEGPSLDKLIEHQLVNTGWTVEKGQGRGQLIIIPQNEFNHPESKKNVAESIPLDHITRIFPILG